MRTVIDEFAARRFCGFLMFLAGCVVYLSSADSVQAFVRGRTRTAATSVISDVRDWTPGGSSAKAQADSRGIRFPCRFSAGADRSFWDLETRLDLSSSHGLDIIYHVDHPAAFRSLTLYLRSGPGWYALRLPVNRAGRSRIQVPVDHWSAEDAPSGIAAVRGIRVSPWSSGRGEDGAIVVEAIAGYRASVALVRPTSSLPESERGYGTRMTQWFSEELASLGLPHAVFDDDAVADGDLRGMALAILPYNSQPGARQMRALESFVGDGGKLLVFYAVSPELAQLMGIRLLSYRQDPRPGRWFSMSFDRELLPGVPARVMQTSTRNIIPAEPLDARTRVVGWWENAQGGRTGDAAWLLSDRGAWMTHVLSREDGAAKRRLLTSVLAVLHPPLLETIAQERSQSIFAIASATGLDAVLAYLETQSRLAGRSLPSGWQAELCQLDPSGIEEPFKVLDRSDMARRLLADFFARIQPKPSPHEIRAVWDHAGEGLHAGDWQRTARSLQAAGLTDVFLYVSRGAVRDPQHPPEPLASAIAALSAAGLRSHVWKIFWNLEGMSATERESLRKKGRWQQTHDGRDMAWLCPANLENVRDEIEDFRRMARVAGVAGVHMDYIRYTDPHACFCTSCRRRFEHETGESVRNWPQDVMTGARRADWISWRAGVVSDAVRQASDAVRAVSPRLTVSAAVFPNAIGSIESIGQDWGRWAREGWLDWLIPMNYTESNAEFSRWVTMQRTLPGMEGRLLPGLGVTASTSRLDALGVLAQADISREKGARGFVLFDLNHTLRNEIFPALTLRHQP